MRERPTPPKFQPRLADRLGRLLDRAVYAIAPASGLRRMQLRRAYEEQTRLSTFEGASKDETRIGSWLGSRLSTDSAMEEDLDDLRSRSRELARNDSIGGAIDSRVNLVVCSGFTPQAQIIEGAGISRTMAREWNRALEQIYRRMYDKFDRLGPGSLWQILRLAERCIATDGECFVVLSDVGGADKPIPLALEVIDAERVSTPPEMAGNPRVRMGVEKDAAGKIVAYYIQRSHPGDTIDIKIEWERYPAERVCHVFEKWFAGQTRGLPWMTRNIKRIKDFGDFDEATIIAAQIEACFAGFITSPTNAVLQATNSANEKRNGINYEDIRPGALRYLDQGEKVEFGAPNRPGNTFEPFMQWNHRRVAGGMNYPYEMVAKNWAGLSFAAGRLSLAEARQFCRAEQKFLIEGILARVWERLVEEAVIVGAINIPARLFREQKWRLVAHCWTPPPWPFVLTPREEIDAVVKAVEENLRTKADAIAEYGGWIEDVFRQRAIERRQEKLLDIIPRESQNTAAAAAAVKSGSEGAESSDPAETDEGDPADADSELKALFDKAFS